MSSRVYPARFCSGTMVSGMSMDRMVHSPVEPVNLRSTDSADFLSFSETLIASMASARTFSASITSGSVISPSTSVSSPRHAGAYSHAAQQNSLGLSRLASSPISTA